MSEMRITDTDAGDLKFSWDPDNEDEVAVAKAAFKKAKKKGLTFYKVSKNNKRGSVITEFDEEAERIVGVPQVVGG